MLQEYLQENIGYKVVSTSKLAAYYCYLNGDQFSIQEDTPVNVYEYDSDGNLTTTSTASTLWGPVAEANSLLGVYTGYAGYGTMGGLTDTWLQVMFSDAGSGFFYLLVPASKVQLTTKDNVSVSDVQALCNKLFDNQKEIVERNLLCGRLIAYHDQKGISVPVEYRKQLYALQTRMEAREITIQGTPGLSDFVTQTPSGYSSFSGDLTNFMGDPKIGIAPIVIAIIVTVVISAIFTILIMNALKPAYSESTSDLKVSKDLAKALATLDPETRQKVVNDLEGQVDAANVQGKMDGSGASTWNTIKSVGLVAAGIFLLPWLTTQTGSLKANPRYSFKK